ncbi:CRISPR-associated exonuclease Cas4 [Thermodesulfovibrio aggregans]|uniref:CRISPR-associated exonuclease Cas4 n=2 Tax=Thermodesulfovibrio aggregans TaxID=86166 RepID=A0A0U9HR84_9BACT|nr:CRISPR-associated exonuclease Cas4 [Thermodesulfovibrio aggregans]
MSRHLEPYQGNPFIEIGRLISEEAYKRDRKEIMLQTPEQTGGMVIDLIKTEGEDIVVGEIKKSSRFEKSAMMQLAYYLMRLKNLGIHAKGLLLFPKEKKKIEIALTEELENELIEAQNEIKRIIALPIPPQPKMIRYCKKCGYQELCWS